MRKARQIQKIFAPFAKIFAKFDSNARDFRHQERRRLDLRAVYLAICDAHACGAVARVQSLRYEPKSFGILQNSAAFLYFFERLFTQVLRKFDAVCEDFTRQTRKRFVQKLQGLGRCVAAENLRVWHRTRAQIPRKTPQLSIDFRDFRFGPPGI